MKKYIKLFLATFIFLLSCSCSKEWLEEKQNIKLIIPKTLNDLDLLLNADFFRLDGRGASEISCDDYEFSSTQFNSLYYGVDRDMITWKSMELPRYGDIQYDEWDLSYSLIQVSNIVLEGLEKITRNVNNSQQFDRIKGTALYHRAKQNLNLAMTFCKYYEQNSSKTDLGIPLKFTSDIDEKVVRSSLEDTYVSIISDLKQAANLLPVEQSNQTFIAKGGAFGLLARAYLFTDNFNEALLAADSSYKYHSYIENYNNVSGIPRSPFLNLSTKEMHIIGILRREVENFYVGRIETELYKMYEENDLRKTLFFRNGSDGKPVFRGSYQGSQLFTATATDEILLIKAECNARLNRASEARNALNLLLENRFKLGTYKPITTTDMNAFLDIVIRERRKELLGRGLRWHDLKRLNREMKYSKSLVRKIGDDVYTLLPTDQKYVFPIPQYIKNITGIK
ncbi:RagB/SusD family nutrient uptake outer membrane protein [Sphingobacterium multivorum]|uniref:RagB/SusD family nutrient uptake outer membrane protein n=1 Tax=Sphingobacterium multivorum TaxID=28454 RepID=UPI00289A0A8A|nr:RagB/SusD family nutrient uptake outer membrane protein [Sphingobacterium multivorum]